MSASCSLRSKIVSYVYPKSDAQLEIWISFVILGFNVTFHLEGAGNEQSPGRKYVPSANMKRGKRRRVMNTAC